MVAGNQVVDITVDPREVRSRGRRLWLRGGIPIVGVLLLVAAILTIAVNTDRENREGVLALTDNLLKTFDNQIAAEVAAYLGPAARRASSAAC